MGWVDQSDSDSVFLHTTLPYSVWGWVGVAVLDKMPRLDLKENQEERIRDIIPPLPRVCICIFFHFYFTLLEYSSLEAKVYISTQPSALKS